MLDNELLNKITSLAASLGGREGDENLALLCRSAGEELLALLRPGVTLEGCAGAFPLAAAWMALGDLAAGEGEVESFTAGAVTVRRGDGTRRRAALRLQALQVMRPYLKDEGFVFRGVRV